MPDPSTRKSTRVMSSAMEVREGSKERFYSLALPRAPVVASVRPRGLPPRSHPPLSRKRPVMSWTLVGLLVLWVPAASAAAQEPREKKPVPVYTNEDLDRVAPHRDETGVNSQPAAPPPPERTAGRAAPS